MIAEGARFDLIIKDLPKNFLGLAADIKFEGDLSAADFRGTEPGEFFQGAADGDKPIELIKVLPDQHKVVLGITLKANRLLPSVPGKTEGRLVSLVFNNDKITPKSFENQVLSVFDQGRRDLPDTIWTVAVSRENTQTPFVSSADISRMAASASDKDVLRPLPVPSEAAAVTLSSPVTDPVILEALMDPRFSGQTGLWAWWWLILILVALLPLLLLVLALANRKNRAGAGTVLEALPKQIKLDY